MCDSLGPRGTTIDIAKNQANQQVNDLTTASNNYQQMVQGQIAANDAATQSIINTAQTLFQQMITQAQAKGQALSSETGGVSNMVNATAGEIINISATETLAIGKLQQGLAQQDYQMTTDAYAKYVDTQDKKTSILQNLNDKLMTAYNTALDAAQKQQAAELQAKNDAQAEADRQAQLKETTLKDQADIQNQKATQDIAAADLAIKQGTFNATYGCRRCSWIRYRTPYLS